MALDSKLFEQLASADTPTICNALELVAPHRRATGFTTKPLVCAFPAMKPIVGFARPPTISVRVPSSLKPADMKALRLAYYEYIAAKHGEPTITVLQDLDPEPGFGAFWGEVNTAVDKGLG